MFFLQPDTWEILSWPFLSHLEWPGSVWAWASEAVTGQQQLHYNSTTAARAGHSQQRCCCGIKSYKDNFHPGQLVSSGPGSNTMVGHIFYQQILFKGSIDLRVGPCSRYCWQSPPPRCWCRRRPRRRIMISRHGARTSFSSGWTIRRHTTNMRWAREKLCR